MTDEWDTPLLMLLRYLSLIYVFMYREHRMEGYSLSSLWPNHGFIIVMARVVCLELSAVKKATLAQIYTHSIQCLPDAYLAAQFIRSLTSIAYVNQRSSWVNSVTQVHQQQWLRSAYDVIKLPMEEWQIIAWSDDFRFQLFQVDVRVEIWRVIDPSFQQDIEKHALESERNLHDITYLNQEFWYDSVISLFVKYIDNNLFERYQDDIILEN